MKNVVHTEEISGFKIEIVPDSDAGDPFTEFEQLGTLYHCHRRYYLGGKSGMDADAIKEIAESSEHISLPVYLYDHSGLSVSCGPFSCQWDSGQVGIIAVSLEKVRENFMCKRITQKIRDKVIKCLKGEIETYDQYLTGQVYGYRITDRNGEQVDSCWDFYGFDDCLSECKAALPGPEYYAAMDDAEMMSRYLEKIAV